MPNKETSFLIQNFLIKEDINAPRGFAYLRLLLPDFNKVNAVIQFIERNDGHIKSQSANIIEQSKTAIKIKLQILFTVLDKDALEQLRTSIQAEDWFKGISFPTNAVEDIIYISNRYGCALEDCLAGYSNLNPGSDSEIVLVGGFWNRIIESMDEKINAPAITNQILSIIGTKQGERLANGIVKILLGNTPDIVSSVQQGKMPGSNIIIKTNQKEPDFGSTLKNFFRGYGYGWIDQIDTDATQGNNGIVTRITFKHSFFFQDGRECSFMEALLSAFFTALLGEPHDFEDNGPYKGKDDLRTFS